MTKKEKINILCDSHPGFPREVLKEIVETWDSIEEKPKDGLFKDVRIEDLKGKSIEYYQIALAFYDLIYHNLTNLGTSTKTLEKSKYKKWVNPIRLMIESDEVTTKQLREVFEFLKDHSFWGANIQSTDKLRKQFSKLHAQFKSNERKQQQPTNTISQDYQRDLLDRLNA